ncbi:MAG: MmcQ/YjbR family DNA-binding protein [Bacteroidetes bacterium]|nr:MmcQ/YjbR family DNA-binding protein [Bacteroidota bacterium]
MNTEDIRNYCLLKKGTTESFPFDEDTLVFKAGGKMYLLMSISSNPVAFSIKCQPEKAVELREIYSSIYPAFHMNKTHWSTVRCDNTIPRKLILEIIDNSYALIIKSLPKKVKILEGL